jgi:parallel beta-helix repeat protein
MMLVRGCSLLISSFIIFAACGGGTAFAQYVVLSTGNAALPTPDGTVDSIWSNANQVAFSGQNTGISGSPILKFLWKPGNPSRICALYQDIVANLTATARTPDDNSIAGDTAVWARWRFADPMRVLDQNTFEIIWNWNNTYYDANWPNGLIDKTYSTPHLLSQQNTYRSNIYTQEWCQDLPPTVVADQLFVCDFRASEWVTGGSVKHRDAFSTTNFDDPSQWGLCQLSSSIVTAPPLDTTGPTVANQTETGIGSSGATVSGVLSDPATPMTCSAVWGTSSGNYTSATAFGNADATGSCAVALTGLPSDSTIYYQYTAKDGQGNATVTSERAFQTIRGRTFYLATDGKDEHNGQSPDHAWRTFMASIPKLEAGDTLIVRNGTYNASNSGYPNIDCTTAKKGTRERPITIKAENERQAFIRGDGSATPFYMSGCAFWVIQGLHLENVNNINQRGDRDAIMVFKNNVDYLTIKNNLIAKTNQDGTSNTNYMNQHAILLQGNNSLIEENEIYWFHRHGIILTNSSGNTVRRNYANSRGCSPTGCNKQWTGPQCPNGVSCNICAVACDKGDSAYIMYTGANATNNVFENNISEGNGTVLFFNGHYTNNDGNQAFGNISLHDDYGIQVEEGRQEEGNPNWIVKNALVRDHVVIEPKKIGFPIGNHSMTVDGLTVLNTSGCCGGGIGFIAKPQVQSGSLCSGGGCTFSFTGNKLLIMGSASSGIRVDSTITNWSLTKVNALNNNPNYNATSSGQCANCTGHAQIDPSLGSCKVRIPTNPSLLAADLGGIGAKAVHQYVNGVLITAAPLWDASNSYKFVGCGATVTGLNDRSGDSCFDVQVRLNVGPAHGCDPY